MQQSIGDVGKRRRHRRAVLACPRTTTIPCPRPNHKKAASYPLAWIMLAIGITVKAEPAPKPLLSVRLQDPADPEPRQRVADRNAINDAGAYAADRGTHIV